MIKKINKIGNSKGIIIERSILKLLGFDEYVKLEVKNQKLVITKIKSKEE